jgi:hypothetical protein
MFTAWYAPATPEGDAQRRAAKEAYERLAEEERDLWREHAKSLSWPDELAADELLAQFSADRRIELAVGAYDCVDLFYLKVDDDEGKPLAQHTAWDHDDTVAIVTRLDRLVAEDNDTIFDSHRTWRRVADPATPSHQAAPARGPER